MLGPTHRAFGFASSAGALVLANKYTEFFIDKEPKEIVIQASVIIAVATITATLPDIDQAIPFIRHRGITHAIWVPLLIAYTYYTHQSSIYYATPLIGLFIGYTSHIIGDAFSTAGVAFLYPFQRYKDYPSGAFHVKGFRGIFQPLYRVGTYTIVDPVWLYYAIGTGLIGLFATQIYA